VDQLSGECWAQYVKIDKINFYANALGKRVLKLKLGTRTLSEPSVCVRRNRDERSTEKMILSLVICYTVRPHEI
jgi:hypothetical protein